MDTGKLVKWLEGNSGGHRQNPQINTNHHTEDAFRTWIFLVKWLCSHNVNNCTLSQNLESYIESRHTNSTPTKNSMRYGRVTIWWTSMWCRNLLEVPSHSNTSEAAGLWRKIVERHVLRYRLKFQTALQKLKGPIFASRYSRESRVSFEMYSTYDVGRPSLEAGFCFNSMSGLWYFALLCYLIFLSKT